MTNRPVRGTKDLLPSDYALFEKIVKSASKIASRYCFENFATPIMEYTEVFNRTLGDTSDVVNKEMYSFIDRGGDSLTLRPEFTAGIMRAVISEGLTHNFPLRLFSYGPVFRHDRPQAGRQRQFHQINFEIIGDSSIHSDAESIKIGYDIMLDLGIHEDISINVNSLGCSESRENYHVKLKEYLLKYEFSLSEDSQKRLHKNPMRILDSKDQNDQKILEEAPIISDFFTKDTEKRFESTLQLLEDLSVPFIINPKLVRGLDYYSHTAFEYVTTKIGAQSAVGGGGRYDGLANIMSAKHNIPAIGLACGIERFMILLAEKHQYHNKHTAIFPIGDDILNSALIFTDKLRSNDVRVIIYNSGKLGKRIDKATSSGANIGIFVGDDEIKSGMYKVKDLEKGSEFILSLDEIINFCNKT
jgi:histidyl-tRNA synthetase